VQSEHVEEADGSVKIFEPARPGRNIRRAGEDVGAGDRVLTSGTALWPAEIGLLASLGHPEVQVHRLPRVAVLSTGSELVDVAQPLGPGQIRNSNSYSLRAQCKQLGIDAVALGIVPDDYQRTRELIAEGLEYDVLLTSGGVSVGQFDFVKDVQDALGAERRLWGVSMMAGQALDSVCGARRWCSVLGKPVSPWFRSVVRPPGAYASHGYRKTTRPIYRAISRRCREHRRTHLRRPRARVA
jgi:molybdopterin molybdotransferase